MDDVASLLKTANFTPGALCAGLIFGTIGFVAFIYGKKNRRMGPFVIGLVMMIYPLFVSNLLLSCIIGTALTAGLYFWRD